MLCSIALATSPFNFRFIEPFMARKARTSLLTAGGTNHFSAAGITELLSKFQGGIAGSIFDVQVDTGNRQEEPNDLTRAFPCSLMKRVSAVSRVVLLTAMPEVASICFTIFYPTEKNSCNKRRIILMPSIDIRPGSQQLSYGSLFTIANSIKKRARFINIHPRSLRQNGE